MTCKCKYCRYEQIVIKEQLDELAIRCVSQGYIY